MLSQWSSDIYPKLIEILSNSPYQCSHIIRKITLKRHDSLLKESMTFKECIGENIFHTCNLPKTQTKK